MSIDKEPENDYFRSVGFSECIEGTTLRIRCGDMGALVNHVSYEQAKEMADMIYERVQVECERAVQRVLKNGREVLIPLSSLLIIREALNLLKAYTRPDDIKLWDVDAAIYAVDHEIEVQESLNVERKGKHEQVD